MSNQFYMKPIVIDAPLPPNTKYIVGVTNKGWIPYTPETFAELVKEWEEWQAAGAKSKLLVEEEPEIFEVASNSDPSKKYKVTKRGDEWTCDCAGFGFRRRCSHIDKIKNKK